MLQRQIQMVFPSCFHPSDCQGGAKLLIVSEIPSLVPRALHGYCTPAIPNYLFLGTALSSCKMKTVQSEDCARSSLNKHMKKKKLNTKTKISFSAAAPRTAAWDGHSPRRGCQDRRACPALGTIQQLCSYCSDTPGGG